MVMQSCHTYDDVIRSIDYMAIGITSTLGIHHVIGWQWPFTLLSFQTIEIRHCMLVLNGCCSEFHLQSPFDKFFGSQR